METPTLPIPVAVLEDHRFVRDALRPLLEEGGCDVRISTGDADAFVASVSTGGVHVAIVDLTLEGSRLDGFELVELLRETCPQVGLVVLSASSAPEVVERCLQLGAAAYLRKLTTSPEEILETVRRVAAGERIFPTDLLGDGLAPGITVRPHSPLEALTPREREVLAHVASGADNRSIASALAITERTVKAHVSALYAKLRQHNRAQLALLARRLGVRPPSAAAGETPRV